MLWAKIVGGVVQGGKKIIGKIRKRKLAKSDKRLAAEQKRRAQIIALGEGGAGQIDTDKENSFLTKIAFEEDAKEPRDDRAYNEAKAKILSRSSIMQFIKDNWKLAVPGIVGLVIVLGGMIYKAFKKR